MKRIAALIGLSLILAACGGSVTTESSVVESTQSTVVEPVDTTTPASTLPEPVATDFPASVLTGAGEVVIEQRPEAIISLSPTATEMLFAVGAGDQVIAVDEYSTFPSAAPVTDLSGFTPNM
ncbi:MAG: ABC transporter substrate-binding protein, partial [Acidimicrobiia bacterium]